MTGNGSFKGWTGYERQTLYDEVWTVPRVHLRSKYGVTDYEFRKMCRALNVPLPRAGHWSRVAAGHHIARPPLPPPAHAPAPAAAVARAGGPPLAPVTA